MRKPQPFDVIELTSEVAAERIDLDYDTIVTLQIGEIGTVIEELHSPREAYMVEFVGDDGEETALSILTPDQFQVVQPWPSLTAEGARA